jgi:hypothetical protein
MSSTESSSVILKTPDDWDAWNKQFKAEAKRKSCLSKLKEQHLSVRGQRSQSSRGFYRRLEHVEAQRLQVQIQKLVHLNPLQQI